MSWIAGIDYSTHAIDVVLIDEDDGRPPAWLRHPLEGADAWERTRNIRNLPTLPGADDVLAVGIEDPAGNHGTNYLYRVQGAILARIPRTMLVQPWRPSQWRKAVGLPGNASKNDVAVHSQWQLLNSPPAEGRSEWRLHIGMDWPQDAHDAHCIALATRQALIREEAA